MNDAFQLLKEASKAKLQDDNLRSIVYQIFKRCKRGSLIILFVNKVDAGFNKGIYVKNWILNSSYSAQVFQIASNASPKITVY